MKPLLFLIPILLFACSTKKQSLLRQQQEIIDEIELVKAAYFKTADSIDQLKLTDTTATRQYELMEAVRAADRQKSATLLRLEKRYHTIELKLRNY